MKKLKKALAMLLTFAVTITCFVLPTAAANITWDGKTALAAGKSYVITSSVKLSKSVVIPEGTTLTVAKGGSLLMYTGSSLTVNGTFTVNSGAKFTNSGTFTVAEGATFKNKGEFSSSISATVKLKGTVNNYKDAIVRVSSKMLVYTTAQINNSGKWYILKSSEATMSGTVVNTVSGDFHVQGALTITVSGEVRSSGYMTVGKNGTVKISGKLWLKTGSGFTRFGKVTTTSKGTFIDNSNKVSNSKLTVNLLIDKATVKSNGIDVSYAQGNIDWKKVANAGIDFAIIRAGRGDLGSGCKMDDYFVQNIKGATANGIDVGVYFYSYATTVEEARAEAKFLVKIIKDYKITYPVILDMEEEMGQADVTAMIDAFFKEIMNAGYYPMFYSYKSWIETYLDMRILDKYAVWLAQTGVSAPTYEGGFYIWQYSHKGKVDGINGYVDLNISYRDFPTLFKQYRINNL